MYKDMAEQIVQLSLPRFEKLLELDLQKVIKSENLHGILNAAPYLKCLKIQAYPEVINEHT